MFINTLINSNNSCLIFFFPNISSIVLEKSLKDSRIIDSFNSGYIFKFILEHIKYIEPFNNTLLDSFKFKMRSFMGSISSINNWLHLFELDEIVNQHKNKSIR